MNPTEKEDAMESGNPMEELIGTKGDSQAHRPFPARTLIQ